MCSSVTEHVNVEMMGGECGPFCFFSVTMDVPDCKDELFEFQIAAALSCSGPVFSAYHVSGKTGFSSTAMWPGTIA